MGYPAWYGADQCKCKRAVPVTVAATNHTKMSRALYIYAGQCNQITSLSKRTLSNFVELFFPYHKVTRGGYKLLY